MNSIHIVTQTFPPRTGGMENVMLSIARNLSLLEWKVTVFADKPWINNERFDHRYTPAPKLIRSHLKRNQLKIQSRPDVYLCDSWKSVSAVPANGVPIVVLAHGQELLQQKKHLSLKAALSRATRIVTSSEATRQLVLSINPKLAAITKCIYPTYGLRQSVNEKVIPNSSVNRYVSILTLCRIDLRKGIFESLEALRLLNKEGYRFHWLIAGTGPELSNLKAASIQDNFLKIVGHVDEDTKQKLYQEADLFLMPSYQIGNSLEGFGITYIEAAKYGLASIGGIAGGASEAVINGKTGWCVEGSDPVSIANALRQALDANNLSFQRGLAAQERFNQHLEGSKVTQKLEKELKDSINNVSFSEV